MAVNTMAEARDVLSGIVQDTWDAVTSIPLLYDNIKDDRPETPAPFGRMVVRHFDGEIAALGSSRHRAFGILFVQLFTPSGAGTAGLDVIADALVKALTSASPGDLQGVRLRSIGATELGIDPSDRLYHQVNVSAQFDYDTNTTS
jgi:hypothetical protein